MATDITDEHRALFQGPTTGHIGEFFLFSCFVHGKPAAAARPLRFPASPNTDTSGALGIRALRGSVAPPMHIVIDRGAER